jgi:BirA family biotin operon repressor/biotin-[acetyl-CoA-carboxylase] ligase
MAFVLPPSAEHAGFRLSAYGTIGSTNAEALALGRAGDPGPLWLVSTHQTAGRGRRGKLWATPRGNLAASLLLRIECPPAKAATLGFVAGLACHTALADAAPGARFALKWPNDVLCGGAKLAGILLESETVAGGARILVVGIGINVVAVPRDLPYAATSLAQAGYGGTAEALFEALSESWLEFAAIWAAPDGIARTRELWLARAAGLGRPVSARVGERRIEGYFETIDDAGQLILRASDGSYQAIAAAELEFGSAPASPVG